MRTHDVHMHILTRDIYPDELFAGRLSIPKELVTLIMKQIDGHMDITKIIEHLSTVIGGKSERIVDLIQLFMMKTIRQCEEFDKISTGVIDVVCPLGLDILNVSEENPSFDNDPRMIIETIALSAWAKKSKGTVLPFFPVDPRRKGVFESMIQALERQGFMGIKMYPALGWFPSNYELNLELPKIYDYCEHNRIPVTVHCSAGGIHGPSMKDGDWKQYTSPNEWLRVLDSYPELVLNMAHFGGQTGFMDYFSDNTPVMSNPSWTYKIVNYMMANYENVFADISFHDRALSEEHGSEYRDSLIDACADGFTADRIMFGSDWPLHLTNYSYSHWVNDIKKMAGEWNWEMIASHNPQSFLGIANGLPERLTKFYEV